MYTHGLVSCHIPETKRNINHLYFVTYILYIYIHIIILYYIALLGDEYEGTTFF